LTVISKLLSHFSIERRLYSVNAEREPITDAGTKAGLVDFEAIFHAHYFHIAEVIARIVKDADRAEELAIEVFWKFWRHPGAYESNPGGWLYRKALGESDRNRKLRFPPYVAVRLRISEAHRRLPNPVVNDKGRYHSHLIVSLR
jgi:hypothetical protein